MRNGFVLISLTALLFSCITKEVKQEPLAAGLKVSENGHFFAGMDNKPFFWLGDTGWLLFTKLSREETVEYLDNRAQKGFNVIQASVIHSIPAVNVYGDSALVNSDPGEPLLTEGNRFDKPGEYDYWDHIDYVIDQAARRGLYMGLVPVWGSNVRGGRVSRQQAERYAGFLAERFGSRPNVIWINGGDVPGSDSIATWNIIGNTLNNRTTGQLITFHPRGRTQSSWWFHKENWLDFNMFQSGHRRYDQDDTELCYGEDNWRYIVNDYQLQPEKPTLDGEPSYEGIPQGLHDTLQPFWKAEDVRRYAYWSVLAGGAGFTYGHSAVMQFHRPADRGAAYGAKKYWTEAINDSGAGQMIHLKNLMLSRSFFERVPDQSLVAEQPGERYDYQLAARGKDYAFVYTYNGKNMLIQLGKIEGERVLASWFDPRTGISREIKTFPNQGVQEFDPPAEPANGNDWVLILDTVK